MLLLGIGLTAFSSASMASLDPTSKPGTWRFLEDTNYKYAKGSASKLLSMRELIPHHTISITLKENLVDSLTFSIACSSQTATPIFDLRVPSLSVRVMDALNSVAYVRFLVDDNTEISLRGEISGRNRLIFGPLTKAQDDGINLLYKEMQKGTTLKIGLLQGENLKVREYEIPLAGMSQFVDALDKSCKTYKSYYPNQYEFLPDYMGAEPSDAAPKDYSLKKKEKDELVNSAQLFPQEVEQPQPEVVEAEPPVQEVTPPEVIPFTPGGGPVSIGPDGLPIGADGSSLGASSGQPVEQPLGTVNSQPVLIGEDGLPIPQGQQGQANGSVANGENNTSFEPAPEEDSGSMFDIF